MTGPFPGIDPWLEAHWRDVHARFMVYACDQIADRLPGDLQARIDEQLAVEYDDAWRTISPDIRVVKQPMTHRILPTTVTVIAAEPCLIPLSDEPSTHRHIEIIDRTSGERVVTAIELLSPANKVGKLGRDSYAKKQTEYLTSGVNLVEIDLIRAGRHI
ncbi:MAG: DUF4058 family protein, partial [Planctomycetota bacterium]|nr:DUF4058 family protein [Planctomycetota bacterium]